jgi:uncharacterized RDD family membrane protein YckC
MLRMMTTSSRAEEWSPATLSGPHEYRDASFAARFFALLIDAAILGGLYVCLLLLSGLILFRHAPPDLIVMIRLFALFSVYFLGMPFFLAMIYFSVFHACCGRTIGKMIMGIQVVSVDNGLLPPGRAFLRYVGYFISAIPAAAGFYWSVIDKSRDAWHDKLAGSHVISLYP